MLKLVVLVSGGGSNLQAILDAIESGTLKSVEIGLVISSNQEAYALKRAEDHGIPRMVISSEEYPLAKEREKILLQVLEDQNPDMVVLAGYLKIVPPSIVQRFSGKIINIHPSLIPDFCGKGFYGMKVHQGVLASGASFSGASVHYVDEGVDTGEIILQEKVPVLPGDTPELLAERVLKAEHWILPEAIRRISEGIK